MNNNQYDIIFTGGGASCRILLYFLSKKDYFNKLNILIIEAENTINDKTWCYWENGDIPFEFIHAKEWSGLQFEAEHFCSNQSIAPFTYACIHGADFNNYFSKQFFPAHPNICLIAGQVKAITQSDRAYLALTETAQYSTGTIFNSIPALAFSVPKSLMWQHFEGWFIKVKQPLFNDKSAVFMDFKDYTDGPFGFLYVLPFSGHNALVEYAFYSSEIFQSAVYEERIRQYLEKQGINDYTIERKERGKIPLYKENLLQSQQSGIIHIGSAGGLIKPSTGYAFNRMVEDSRMIAASFGTPNIARRKRSKRFLFYDRLLLRIIQEDPACAVNIFKQLFRQQSMHRILTFLNEDSNLLHELSIFWRLPWWPFLQRIKLFQ